MPSFKKTFTFLLFFLLLPRNKWGHWGSGLDVSGRVVTYARSGSANYKYRFNNRVKNSLFICVSNGSSGAAIFHLKGIKAQFGIF